MSETLPEEPDRRGGAPHPRMTARIFGQERAEARFLSALGSGRMPHGWLLTGPRGIGKATLAWRIARHMLRETPAPSLDMSPEDPVFRRVAALGAPEVFLCRRPWDAKAKRLRSAITVEEVRALKSFFQFSAPDARWRIAIVDALDEATDAASNALLKILEEPPARALLLLVCHNPARLLTTLRSRCRTLACMPLAPEDMAAAMAGASASTGPSAAALAQLACGSVGRALDLAAQDGVALYEEIAGVIATAPALDRRRAIALAEACAGRGSEARYDLTAALLGLAIARLALGAVGRAGAPLTQGEDAARARLATSPMQARLWADLAPRIEARTGHARAVHLDPAQVILDTFLQIDAAAAKAIAQAA